MILLRSLLPIRTVCHVINPKIKMKKNSSPKILVCGMPRSMTTWVFNVLRELISPLKVKTLWIDPRSLEEKTFLSCEELVLAKCHHFTHQLADAADIVIYSYRDLRTAAVSYHRKFGSPCSREQIDGWIEAARAWLPRADIVLQYESVERLQLDTIAKLRQLLKSTIDSDCLDTSADEDILRRVDNEFSQKQTPAQISYDSRTMILPGHRTYQPDPVYLSTEEKAIFDRIEREFQIWLDDFGYIHSIDHGQELDYRIARILLNTFTSATVVDVGAERGSFIQLAHDAGSKRIIGFEPLPRHFQYLIKRYDKVDQVEIYPLAISSQNGVAQLHIATDLEGNELDFHHTLSDLGDSATVIRSTHSLAVETFSLSDLADKDIVPSDIHFLKIDTDGHDLSVLNGLGNLRPRVIMAEYWDSLPETSGNNPYQLTDLADWSVAHGYTRMIVVRRRGRIELVELDAPWTLPGDWGNVFFLRQDFEFSIILNELNCLSKDSYAQLCGYIFSLVKECEAKEAVIRHLEAELLQLRSNGTFEAFGQSGVQAALADKEHVIQMQSTALAEAQAEIEQNKKAFSEAQDALYEKEEIIRLLAKTVFAFRIAHGILRPADILKKAIQKVKCILAPRLGNLTQHSPVRLDMPGPYSPMTPAACLPVISIVTPSLGQGRFIEKTLLSALEQDYPNLEYFVQDCCSTDETVGILIKYSGRLSGYCSCLDNGQSQAINLGFSHTTGEIMAWLNSDDFLLPGSLAFIGDFFARNPKVDVVYGNRILVNEDDLEIGRWILPGHDSEVLSWADFVPQETLFWRRSIWNKVGARLDETFRFAMDWDLLIRFREAGACFAHVSRFLGAFRIHEKQKTSFEIDSIGCLEMDRIRERVLGYVPGQKAIHKAIGPFLMRHMAMDLFFRVHRKL